MPSITLTLQGLDEALAVLQRFQDEVPQVMGDVLGQIGDDMVGEMQSTCPVDTGNLQSNISITDLSEDALEITSAADYSGFVEYGTWKMAAQPFFEPAVNQARGEAVNIARDALQNLY